MKYLATSYFGDYSPGDRIDCIKLCEGGFDTVLIYIPSKKGECALLELCKEVDDFVVPLTQEAYVNLDKRDLKSLINKLQKQYDNWGK